MPPARTAAPRTTRSPRTARTRNKQPRPEAEVLGGPPRGGRSRGVAPFGGGEVSRAAPTGSEPARSASRSQSPACDSAAWGAASLANRGRIESRPPTQGPVRSEGTPDRSKLFGSHGQRPWLHEVVRNANSVHVFLTH